MAALLQLSRDFPCVLPIEAYGKRPAPGTDWVRYTNFKPDQEEIKNWETRFPDCNAAVVTGKVSGIVVLDIDTTEGLDQVVQMNKNAADTLVVKTGRGYHLYYKSSEKIASKVNLLKDVDLKAEGGYVVAPPSINRYGQPYCWGRFDKHMNFHEDSLPWVSKILTLPSWILSKATIVK